MYSVKLLGTHQRLDRAAHRHLSKINDAHSSFPGIKQILRFEAKNGPDGIKRKSPSQDEPWHYYDPFDEEDSGLLEIIEEHFSNLVNELKCGNNVRSSFEASWLAHALVDGLTPAHHHHHYEQGIEEIYGTAKELRDTKLKKVVVPTSTKHGFLKGNWKLWGAKGLLSTHMLFEGGAALIIHPMLHSFGKPSGYDLKTAEKVGLIEYFKRLAREVALLDMYERFYDSGWTSRLAQEVRDELAPRMVKIITVAWHLALLEAQPKLVAEVNTSTD
jgi:hypothetical protein